MHLATGALINAYWDLWAKIEKKPLWQLLADMVCMGLLCKAASCWHGMYMTAMWGLSDMVRMWLLCEAFLTWYVCDCYVRPFWHGMYVIAMWGLSDMVRMWLLCEAVLTWYVWDCYVRQLLADMACMEQQDYADEINKQTDVNWSLKTWNLKNMMGGITFSS